MARWTSPVILRDCHLAPLSSITDHVKEHQASNSVAKLLVILKKDITSMSSQMAKMEEVTMKLLNIEAKVDKLELATDAASRVPEYVIHDDRGCCHRIIVHTGPPVDWITPCRFEFGRVRHTIATEPVAGYKRLCHRFLHSLREQRKLTVLEIV